MRKTAVVACVLVGCGTSDPPPNPNPPSPPDQNDAAFTANGLRHWYLIGDGTTPGDDRVAFEITAPASAHVVDAYIADLPPIRMAEQNGKFALEKPVADLPAGSYDVLFSANNSNAAFAKVTFEVSAVYYVLVSTDYDFSDPTDGAIQYMDWLHRDHAGMRITHFWAPYTYTDPMVDATRQATLDAWIQKQRDTFHDEIALHIHPYCTFVTHAGVPCITDQSTVYPAGDMSGYTIKLAAYGRSDFSKLLQDAFTIFAQHNLGKPRTFRAGGWTADLSTLQTLAENGFIADTSALNWARIEEWQGKELYTWTMQHWGPIDDTSQPYVPSQTDVLHSTPGSDLSLLEVPDNGVMIDYVSLAEMNGIFDANWDGQPFASPPRTLMMGFHPARQLSYDEYMTVTYFLKYADQHLYSRDMGPVVYTTLSDLTPAFPAQ